MIAHRRYLAFRTERLEKQNRWLTILASTIALVVLIVVTSGPAYIGATSDAAEMQNPARDINSF